MMPMSPLSSHCHSTASDTSGTSDGMKKIVRKMPRPGTLKLSRSASESETSSPSGIENTAKNAVFESAFQKSSSVNNCR